MAYATLSSWTTTEWTDDLEAVARDKFVPLIMGVGATGVPLIRVSNGHIEVALAHYPAQSPVEPTVRSAEVDACPTGTAGGSS